MPRSSRGDHLADDLKLFDRLGFDPSELGETLARIKAKYVDIERALKNKKRPSDYDKKLEKVLGAMDTLRGRIEDLDPWHRDILCKEWREAFNPNYDPNDNRNVLAKLADGSQVNDPCPIEAIARSIKQADAFFRGFSMKGFSPRKKKWGSFFLVLALARVFEAQTPRKPRIAWHPERRKPTGDFKEFLEAAARWMQIDSAGLVSYARKMQREKDI